MTDRAINRALERARRKASADHVAGQLPSVRAADGVSVRLSTPEDTNNDDDERNT